MNPKPPPNRHEFADEWDEIGYLYDKLLYWLYQRVDPQKARLFSQRLEHLLPRADPGHNAILGEECWSLINEAKGNFRRAIQHRENEIRLIRRLWRISQGKPYEKTALQGYGCDDLGDRLNLLAMLYHDIGRLDKAIRILQQSRRLCQEHGVPFRGATLLRDYREEKRTAGLVT